MTFQSPAFRLISAVIFSTFALTSFAASLTVIVTDATGKPVLDAVAYAEPELAMPAPKQFPKVEIEQKGKKFLPMVSVVQTGTAILFPNNDTVRHHIYSFSPAKIFEQKLYSGVPEKPVVFDKPGTVVLGCNIHDFMLAYIYVVDTAYFAKTDVSGKLNLELPSGKYQLKLRHMDLPAGDLPEQTILMQNDNLSVNIKLNVKPKTRVSERDSKSPIYNQP
ncbi:MAG: methylamine utilization protein [Pseudomonadota bacterium]